MTQRAPSHETSRCTATIIVASWGIEKGQHHMRAA